MDMFFLDAINKSSKIGELFTSLTFIRPTRLLFDKFTK